MLFNVFVGRTLYLSTEHADRAFSFFKKHSLMNSNVRIEFVNRCLK